MFTSKIKFLHLIEKDGKRGWSGTLREWDNAIVHELVTEATLRLKAVNKSMKEIWK